MITYRSVSLLELINELMGRLRNYRNTVNIDWTEIVNAINLSVIETTALVHTLFPENYIEETHLVSGTFLGERFIKPIKLLVLNNQENLYHEARYINPNEITTLSDNLNTAEWVGQKVDDPVYTIFGNTIYFAYRPGNVVKPCAMFNRTEIGILHGYYYPQDLRVETDVLVVPYECLELIYNHTMIKLMGVSTNKDSLMTLMRETELLAASLYSRYSKAQETQKKYIETFNEENPYVVGFRNVKNK